MKDSEFIEWNGGPLGKHCLINIDCNVKLTLKDRNKNIVNEPYVLSSDDADIVMIGPQGTLYIKDIDNSDSANGIYYINYKRYMVGRYYLYIRLREEQAAIYPMSIVIYTETVDPSRSILLSKDYKI